MIAPRLLSLAEAKAYLKGRHPGTYGVKPVSFGVYDRRAIDAALDRKSGLAPLSAPHDASAPANDIDDELDALRQRIEKGAGLARNA